MTRKPKKWTFAMAVKDVGKPRIQLTNAKKHFRLPGKWSCRSVRHGAVCDFEYIGYGRTPKAAYRAWRVKFLELVAYLNRGVIA